MRNSMYLVRVKKDWYHLRYTPDHSVLGCTSDVEALLNTVRRYTRLWKGNANLMAKAMSERTYQWKASEAELIRNQYEYDHRDPELERRLQDAITEVLAELKEETPMKKVKSRLKVNRTTSTEPLREEVHSTTETRRPRTSTVLKKKRIVK